MLGPLASQPSNQTSPGLIMYMYLYYNPAFPFRDLSKSSVCIHTPNNIQNVCRSIISNCSPPQVEMTQRAIHSEVHLFLDVAFTQWHIDGLWFTVLWLTFFKFMIAGKQFTFSRKCFGLGCFLGNDRVWCLLMMASSIGQSQFIVGLTIKIKQVVCQNLCS